MKTRSHLQRRTGEPAESFTAKIQKRPFNQPEYDQPQTGGSDFSQVDLFSYAPQRPTVQAKLTIGQANDQYEQEADRVASQVVSMPNAAPQPAVQRQEAAEEEVQTKPIAATITPLVQRQGMPQTSGQPPKKEDEEPLQTKAAATPQATPSLETQLSSSKGGGTPLPESVRSFMEPRFGADFSQVRVHTGETAVQMNRDLNAQAFTHGTDIYYGAGKSPSTDELTAHELTHVVQQSGGGSALDRKPVQRRTGETIQLLRGRRNAIVGQPTGLDNFRNSNLTQTPNVDGADEPDDPMSAVDDATEIGGSLVEDTTDLLGDEELGKNLANESFGKDANEFATGLGSAGGLLGLFQAVRQVQGAELDKKIEGGFGIVGSLTSMAESGADIANTVAESEAATMAKAVTGTVGEGIDAIKQLVLTIKRIYDAYQDHTSVEGASTAEKLETGMATVRGLVEAASKAVSMGKEIVDMLKQAAGGLEQAVPGLSIALGAIDTAIEVYNIIKAKSSQNFVKGLLKSNYWQQANVFGKGKQRRQQQAAYAQTYAEEIQKMKTKYEGLEAEKKQREDAGQDATEIIAKQTELQSLIQMAERQNSALQEHSSLTNLSEINSDRVANAGFNIGVNLTKIVGDVLSLVPEPNTQAAAMSLKAAAAGAKVGKSIFTKVRQWARDKAASDPTSSLNGMVDTTQSSAAKQMRQKETIKYIFSQIATLPPANAPEFAAQKDRVEQLIEATGASPNALYRTNRTEGLDGAIKLLMKAQSS